MYHNNSKNQVSQIKKSFLTKGFLHKDFQSGYISSYLGTLTSSQQEIAHYLLGFRSKPTVKLINASIAKKIGCNVRTVIRATNKFNADGFIIKKQPEPYDANLYTFNEKVKKGPDSFTYLLNNLPSKSQDIYISHGIFIDHKNKKIVTQRNVTPYLSSSVLDNLFINSSLLLTRAREKDQDFSKKIKGRTMNPIPKSCRIDKKLPEPVLTIEQKRQELLKKIDACRMKLANPQKYIKYGVVKSSIVYFQKELQQYLRDLKEYDELASMSH